MAEITPTEKAFLALGDLDKAGIAYRHILSMMRDGTAKELIDVEFGDLKRKFNLEEYSITTTLLSEYFYAQRMIYYSQLNRNKILETLDFNKIDINKLPRPNKEP